MGGGETERERQRVEKQQRVCICSKRVLLVRILLIFGFLDVAEIKILKKGKIENSQKL